MSNRIKTPDTLRVIRCTIGEEIYGLDMSWVVNIQRIDRLRRVSDKGTGNAGFVGWLAGRNSEIPVFSLAKRLGRSVVSTRHHSLHRIIILPAPAPPTESVNQEEHLWGLMVDQVSQVIEVSSDRFEPLPPLAINPTHNYFEGVIKQGKDLILFLSPEWLHPDTSLYTEGMMAEPHQLEAQLKAQLAGPTSPGQRRASQQLAKGAAPPHQNGTASKMAQAKRHSPGQLLIFSTQPPTTGDRVLAYGLSITQVPEILRPLPVLPIPAAPDYVLGLVNWRDRVVPIVDLDARIGLSAGDTVPSNGSSRLVIARGMGESLVGFPIQPSVRAVRLPIPHRPAREALALDESLVRGIVELEDLTLVIPNIQDMLS